MKRKIFLFLFVICLITNCGCISLKQIDKKELEKSSPRGQIYILTKDLRKFLIPKREYSIKKDTIFIKGEQILLDGKVLEFNGKIPLEDIVNVSVNSSSFGGTGLVFWGVILSIATFLTIMLWLGHIGK